MSRQLTVVPRPRRRSHHWTTRGVAALSTGALALAGLLGVVAPASASVAAAPAAAVAAAVPAAAGAPLLDAAAPVVPGRGNTAVNMFQWTWNAIASECTSTLGPAGYAYVQTSPPQEHILGAAWWTSYQPVSYKIESKLGTRAEYKAMVDTCGAAGVKVIADTVINHMTGADGGSGTGFAGTPYGIESFPGPAGGYGPNDFNDCKTNIASYTDRYQVQNCRLVSLQDLRTGSDYVRSEIAAYINDMISLGVVGFRIDAAKHIPAADLEAIKAKLTNPNVFWVHEVIGGGADEPVQPSEYLGSGDSHEFNYARTLKSRFDGSIAQLKTISSGLLASDRAGVFVDNHDTERNGETMNYTWGAKYKLANVFMLAYPYGWPTVYSGYTFTDKDAGAPQQADGQVVDASCSNTATWTCAHRWPEIKNMVAFRTTVGTEAVTSWWDNGSNQIAFGRGSKGYVVINNEASAVTRTFQSSLPAGTYCDVVAGDGCTKTVTVNASGQLTATIPAYGALALHVGALSGGVVVPVDPAGNQTVYYSTAKGWSAYNVHYQVGSGAWTAVPGKAMTAACTGWVSATIATGGATVTAAFTNGASTWDNNGSANYTLTGATAAVKDGAVTTTNPCGAPTTPATNQTIYYSTAKGWSAYNVHYKVGTGGWTVVPGKAMTAACTGWVSATVATSGATVTAAFTNGSGTWDNNGSANYTLTGPTAVVKDGAVTTTNPCA